MTDFKKHRPGNYVALCPPTFANETTYYCISDMQSYLFYFNLGLISNISLSSTLLKQIGFDEYNKLNFRNDGTFYAHIEMENKFDSRLTVIDERVGTEKIFYISYLHELQNVLKLEYKIDIKINLQL